MKELQVIQSRLKAPKDSYNAFGKYKYRSAASIIEAVKPLLWEQNCTLTITDSIVEVGQRIYVQATAILKNAKGDKEETTAFAREEDAKKGMDSSQVTGAASSYARKYALGGLFCIDDNRDSDATNTHGQPVPAAPQAPSQKPSTPKAVTLDTVKGWLAKATKESDLMAIYKNVPGELMQDVLPLLTERKKQLKGGAA